MQQERPNIGIGVIIIKDGKILLGKRKSSSGVGEYAGHLELNESIEVCARREVMEEAGINISNVRFLCIQNANNYSNKHYVTIGMISDWESGEPKNLEPEKCEGWDWYSFDSLPKPLYATVPAYIEACKTGKNYFEKL